MPLDPHLAERVALVAGLRWADLADPGAAARWAAFEQDPGPWSAPHVLVEDLLVQGPHGGVPVRVHRPRGSPRCALLWVHGGGFASGGLDMRESQVVAAELAARSAAQVVTVDYRLAGPGVRYPLPLDDVQAAWRWTAATAAAQGLPVSAGGASAGAALALATVLRERDAGRFRPERLLLAYPFVHFPSPAPPDEELAALAALPPVLRIRAEDVEQMVRRYVGRITDLPVLALPGAAPLHDLPATWLLLSEHDDLRASGALLARQLADAGVPVRQRVAAGMPHGHLNRTPALPEVDRSLDWFALALREDGSGPGPAAGPGAARAASGGCARFDTATPHGLQPNA